MDFLGLKNLTIINNIINDIKTETNEDIDFSNEHYSYIESYFDKEYDPVINIIGKTMIIFGDVLKGILMNPRAIYTDDLTKLDPDITKSIKSRYLDLITLNTRPFEEIFKFIYGQTFNNIVSKNDYIVDYYQFGTLIYNIYYLALNKIFKNSDNTTEIINDKRIET